VSVVFHVCHYILSANNACFANVFLIGCVAGGVAAQFDPAIIAAAAFAVDQLHRDAAQANGLLDARQDHIDGLLQSFGTVYPPIDMTDVVANQAAIPQVGCSFRKQPV
jgi:hypothetical protein